MHVFNVPIKRRKAKATREPMLRIYLVLASGMVLASTARVIADQGHPDYTLISRIIGTAWF